MNVKQYYYLAQEMIESGKPFSMNDYLTYMKEKGIPVSIVTARKFLKSLVAKKILKAEFKRKPKTYTFHIQYSLIKK